MSKQKWLRLMLLLMSIVLLLAFFSQFRMYLMICQMNNITVQLMQEIDLVCENMRLICDQLNAIIQLATSQ